MTRIREEEEWRIKGQMELVLFSVFFLEMAYFDALLMVFLEVIDISTWALGYGIRMIR